MFIRTHPHGQGIGSVSRIQPVTPLINTTLPSKPFIFLEVS
ncbi:hypothetical protein [Allocoleopsis franciscana]|nr:hypothetical protein [Allocoleopsis franciscana]